MRMKTTKTMRMRWGWEEEGARLVEEGMVMEMETVVGMEEVVKEVRVVRAVTQKELEEVRKGTVCSNCSSFLAYMCSSQCCAPAYHVEIFVCIGRS